MAALLENSFAFLDGEEDGAKIIEAAKAVAEKEAEEKKKISKQQQSEQAVKARHRYQPPPGSMRAKRIILPRYIRRRDIVVWKGNPDGAEQNIDAGRNFSGGDSDSGGYKGAASYQGSNYRRDGNDYKGSYGGRGGYRGRNGRGGNNSGYNGRGNGSRDGDCYRNNGGNNVGKNNSGDSVGVVDDDGWQISGRRRVGRRGQSRRGYNNGLAYEGQVATVNRIQCQDGRMLEKGPDGQVIERPKSGGFEPNECLENGNRQNNGGSELSGISEKDLSVVQQDVDGEKKSIVAEKDLHGAEGDVADAKTDGPKKSKSSKVSKKKKPQIQHNHVKKAEENDDSNNMTLEEYEKVQSEKLRASESLNKVEQRKVSLDKDFEKMQLVGKKSENDGLIKPNTKMELVQRKDGVNKDEKARKSMSINEFLKPAEVETSEMSGHQHNFTYEKYRTRNLPQSDRGLGQGFDGEKINGGWQQQRQHSGRGFAGERITGGHPQERPYNGHGYEGKRTNGGHQHRRSYNGRGAGHHDDWMQNGSNGGGESGTRHERPLVRHRDGYGYAAPAQRFDNGEPQNERPYKNGLSNGKELNVEDPNQFPALGGGTKS